MFKSSGTIVKKKMWFNDFQNPQGKRNLFEYTFDI